MNCARKPVGQSCKKLLETCLNRRAREYGIQGRWPSPDPAGIASVHLRDPQTWNRYGHVRNNPLALVDPTGMVLFEGAEDGCDGEGTYSAGYINCN
jgi:RHS repeat-associated protein